MSEELKNAYLITISDLNIALCNCGIFEFKRRKEYTGLINKYEELLK